MSAFHLSPAFRPSARPSPLLEETAKKLRTVLSPDRLALQEGASHQEETPAPTTFAPCPPTLVSLVSARSSQKLDDPATPMTPLIVLPLVRLVPVALACLLQMPSVLVTASALSQAIHASS